VYPQRISPKKKDNLVRNNVAGLGAAVAFQYGANRTGQHFAQQAANSYMRHKRPDMDPGLYDRIKQQNAVPDVKVFSRQEDIADMKGRVDREKYFSRLSPDDKEHLKRNIERDYDPMYHGDAAYNSRRKYIRQVDGQPAHVLAHEIGHAKDDHALGGNLMLYGSRFSQLAPFALPIGINRYHRHKDVNPRRARLWRNATLGVAGAGAALHLGLEGSASIRGYNMLRRAGASQADLGQARRQYGRAWGNYAATAGIPLAAAGAYYGYQSYKQRQQKKLEAAKSQNENPMNTLTKSAYYYHDPYGYDPYYRQPSHIYIASGEKLDMNDRVRGAMQSRQNKRSIAQMGLPTLVGGYTGGYLGLMAGEGKPSSALYGVAAGAGVGALLGNAIRRQAQKKVTHSSKYKGSTSSSISEHFATSDLEKKYKRHNKSLKKEGPVYIDGFEPVLTGKDRRRMKAGIKPEEKTASSALNQAAWMGIPALIGGTMAYRKSKKGKKVRNALLGAGAGAAVGYGAGHVVPKAMNAVYKASTGKAERENQDFQEKMKPYAQSMHDHNMSNYLHRGIHAEKAYEMAKAKTMGDLKETMKPYREFNQSIKGKALKGSFPGLKDMAKNVDASIRAAVDPTFHQAEAGQNLYYKLRYY
jgi:hypothetical protein